MLSESYNPTRDQTWGQPGERVLYKYFVSVVGADAVTSYPEGKEGIDFSIDWKGLRVYIDSEVRSDWFYGEFPYDTIHIPYRKRGMIKSHLPFRYYVIRRDLAAFMAIAGDKILGSAVVTMEIKEKKNSFFNVSKLDIIGYRVL